MLKSVLKAAIVMCASHALMTSPVLAATEVTTLSKASIEDMRRQAVDEYRAKNFSESENLFYQVLSADHEAPSATYAVEYLQKIMVENGETDKALNQYDDLKAKGVIKDAPILDSTQLSTLKILSEPGKLEEHLASLFQLGGTLLARTSLLGVVLDGLGFQKQATYYLGQAQSLADAAQEAAAQKAREKLSTRPLHFIWPSFYEDQIRVPKRFEGQFQIISFKDVKEEDRYSNAFRNIDDWYTNVHFGIFIRNDSNIQKSSTGESGPLNDYALSIASQKNISKPMNFGFGYTMLGHRYMEANFQRYNFLSHVGSGWISHWNQKDNEFRLRYDFALTMHRIGVPEIYDTTHGPQLAWACSFAERYLLNLSYSLKFNTDKSDALTGVTRRSGKEHELNARVAYPGEKKTLQPYLFYTLNRNVAEGAVYDTIRHKLGSGTAFLLGTRSSLNFEANYRFGVYPGTSQLDQLKTLRLDLSLPLSKEVFSFLLSGAYQTQSSSNASLNYSRFEIGGGVDVGFKF